MRRAIEVEGLGRILELTKVVRISGLKSMIILEEYKPGEWRLTYSADMGDWSKVRSLKMIRED